VKKLLIIFLILLIIAVGVIYRFWQEIFQFSAESIIMKSLPPYVAIERIIFDLKDNRVEVKDFRVKNPPGYQQKYLASIDKITCDYKRKGDNILDGIEVTNIEAQGPTINIERLKNGRMNINEMDTVMEKSAAEEAGPAEKAPAPKEEKKKAVSGKDKRNISDIVKLPKDINLTNGKVVFLDKAAASRPYMLTFDDVNGVIELGLSDDYTKVSNVSSTGKGILNSDNSQKVKWNVSLDPTKQNLTMSSRIEPEGIDLTLIRPYYDKFSPIYIEKGTFSGTLVFDFDNGNIGSMNTVNLRNLVFKEKENFGGAQYWQAVIPELIKYLQSSPREITFDFTIKGDMNNPSFNIGPITRKALQSMVVDKIVDAISGEEKGGAQGAPSQSGAQQQKSDTEQVMDLLEGLLKK